LGGTGRFLRLHSPTESGCAWKKKGALGGNMVSPEGRSREAAEDAAMELSRELAAGDE
jgi:hypothetical protein